ncbi:P-loop containing nucleoside triphosphate hydrolase protein [Chytriomyces sp. MP71]|nr:P-loop containing nucleoside triphosphate hydrolase protein [Chytriomyces sp. MP71]
MSVNEWNNGGETITQQAGEDWGGNGGAGGMVKCRETVDDEPEAPFDPKTTQDAREDAPASTEFFTQRQLLFNKPGATAELIDDEFEGNPNIKPRDLTMEKKLFGGKQVMSGLNFDKYNDLPIQVSGNNVPAPMPSFSQSNLHPLLKSNITIANYANPTPVQTFSIPVIADGRDLMGCAQTGSGKTGGFLFPILSKNFYDGPPTSSSGRVATPLSLILAPTRELAAQIYEETKKFAYRSWVRPCVVYGGKSAVDLFRELERGCGLLVATPGRLIDLLERGRITLAKVKYLVLDEADRMLDMGFEVQIRQIIEQYGISKDRQTLMFSATFPRDIQILARDFLTDYIFLAVGRVGSTSENIKQNVVLVQQENKRSLILDLLHTDLKIEKEGHPSPNLTLVFAETKRETDDLCFFLTEHGFPAECIHGDLTQQEREKALASFKSGVRPVLVATAVASRGLDIPDVRHVIIYDMPSDIDEYVHRIGRTARAGNEGKATAFFCIQGRDLSLIKDLHHLLMESNQHVPEFLEALKKEGRWKDVAMQPRRGGNRAFGAFGGCDFRNVSGESRFGAPGRPHNYKGAMFGRGGGGSGNPKPGDWRCASCSNCNFAIRSECFKCGVAKPDGRGGGGRLSGGYGGGSGGGGYAAHSGDGYGGVDTCTYGGEAMGFNAPGCVGGRGGREVKSGDWPCPFCNKSNFAKRRECFSCSKPRPPRVGADALNCLPDLKPGEWVCPSCKTNNFPTRHQCCACSEPRPPSVGADPAKNVRKTKPGDWDCAGCKAINYAQREGCYRCHEPKSTGAGGSSGGGVFVMFA